MEPVFSLGTQMENEGTIFIEGFRQVSKSGEEEHSQEIGREEIVVDGFTATLLRIESNSRGDARRYTEHDWYMIGGNNEATLWQISNIEAIYASVENPPGHVHSFIRLAYTGIDWGWKLYNGHVNVHLWSLDRSGKTIYDWDAGPAPIQCSGSTPLVQVKSIDASVFRNVAGIHVELSGLGSIFERCSPR
jgi:hypothetical protein